jgi:hypothetical protein
MLVLKPQDVVVLLKVYLSHGWTYPSLAESLGMSQGEVHAALKRAAAAQLMNPTTRQPAKAQLLEFLVHGARYAFPGVRGAATRGMPTAHSAAPLKARLTASANELPIVWPDAQGDARGEALAPLFRSVPAAARNDERLYELLALVDALRVGRARERHMAEEELTRRLA